MTDVFLYQGEANPNDVRLRGGTSTAYVLSGDFGSYVYTGQSATFVVGRKLAGSNGSYAYTGQTATFVLGRKLAGTNGSYTYTGQSATFVLGRKLAGTSGSYTYSGQTATFTLGRALAGASGSYLLNGQAATLTVARNLAGAAGSYAYAGQTATLTYHTTVQEQNSGGYPTPRGRSKEDLKKQRIALGILPPEALEAVDLSVKSTVALSKAQPETQAATDALLDQQRAQELFIKAYLAVYPMLEEAAILEQMQALIQEREFILFLSAL